ncbi:hypothetical protein BGZ46_007888 [Entomortierella lignicola]|nr:hypothetical protein BGZ46_007888 [Entomortierella lignicola]
MVDERTQLLRMYPGWICGSSTMRSFVRGAHWAEAAYLQSPETAFSHPVNIAMETSQSFRALPAWATLRVYGREGYRRISEENSSFADDV